MLNSRGILSGLLVFSVFSCDNNALVFTETFKDHLGNDVRMSLSAPAAGTVILFLSPDCPLCQGYTLTINKLRSSFMKKDVCMVGVFPGKYMMADSVKKFIELYALNLDLVILDPDKRIAGKLDARVTPEAFLLDREGRIMYRGRIDDWAYETGKKKPAPETHDLSDAMEQLVGRGTVSVQDTEAVGCFIE